MGNHFFLYLRHDNNVKFLLWQFGDSQESKASNR